MSDVCMSPSWVGGKARFMSCLRKHFLDFTVMFSLAVTAGAVTSTSVVAQARNVQAGESYVPTIWVDPDGCEHWVMDDGAEGYMTPHVSRDGIPVCRRGDVCGVMNADQLFATDSFRISAAGQKRLSEFFSQSTASFFMITGHTDSTASDAYNLRLSLRRANAVARVAAASGANVTDIRGFGERQPVASNATAAGRAQNRRVEILCFR